MKKFLFVAALVVAVFAAAPSQAEIIIDFGGTSSQGGVIMTTAPGVWTGSNIPVPSMNFIDTPLNAGIHMTDALMNFKFGGGFNEVQIVTPGGFAPANLGAGALFLSGTFSTFDPTLGGPGVSIFAAGPDTKNPLLLTYAGLPTDSKFVLFGFTIASFVEATGTRGAVYQPFSSDMSNTLVPEPGSMLLLGTGLFGLAAAVRRRIKK